ncbi:sensor histidine kinase [Pseudonocardia spinosispora]|uniref:sensor histidine kinase n=1 Tax=Pseudonocardia spinosispora TaxID=103441 RepID=UPI00042256F1|nr:HAMP domain-containing sensor histidine kinase [Pseudonocardia spinosispora]
MRFRSLRTRLVAGVLVLAAVGLLVTDAATLLLLRSYLDSRTDTQLTAIHEQWSTADQSGLPIKFPRAANQQALRSVFGDVVLEKRDIAGVVTERFPSDRPRLPHLAPVDQLRAQGELGRPFTLVEAAPGGGRTLYRAIVWSRPNDQGTVVVAVDMSGQAATARQLLLIELIVTLIVLVLLGVLGLTVVRLGLRPLEDVENTADSIVAAGDLSRRVPIKADSRTEIGRLSVTLNGMLANLQAAFAQRAESETRLRRFVADASHELRTPTAGIRGFAELYRHGVVTEPEQVRELFARIEAEATRMGLLVDDLLLLARLDQQRPLEPEPVDLLPVAVDTVETARAIAPDRPLRLEIIPEHDEPGAPPPIVLGDEPQLRQVSTNLVSNALRHTAPDTPVTVRVGVPAGQDVAVFEVVDHGPGLAPEDAERVFERFYRSDPARARLPERPDGDGIGGGVGVGLGLSIVTAIVAAHQGTVCHEPTPGGGATFRVTIPLHSLPSSS